METQQLSQVLKKVFQEKKFKSHEIDFTGGTQKYDNHMSDIHFVKVNCVAEDGTKKILELVIKKGKQNPLLRKVMHTREVFMQEIILYEIIFPLFKKFQEKKKLSNIFNPLVESYKAIIEENTEYIILQNLKAEGYKQYNRKIPLDRNHLEICLKAYGKLHAVSFAVKDQQKLKFEYAVKNLSDIYKNHFKGEVYKTMQPLFVELLEILRTEQEINLHAKLLHLMEKESIGDRCLKLLYEETAVVVLNHGDPWINNLLFSYKVKNMIF